MLEHSSSDIDVDRLMHQIRDAVARESHSAGRDLPGPSSHTSNGDQPPGSLRLQPVFQPNADKQYHVNDLLRFHGEEFVRNAYRALLLRQPDDAGLAQHLEGLASGRFNKMDVLASLHSSPEGRRSQVRVAGLSIPATVRRLGRIPLIGYLIRLMIALLHLPRQLEHQRQLEFYLTSQQQRIVHHQNQLLEGLQRLAEQQESVHSSLRQHEEVHNHLIAQQAELQKAIASRFAEAREYVDQTTVKLNEQIASQTHALNQHQQAQQSMQQQLDSRIQEQLTTQQRELTLQQRELMTQRKGLTAMLEEVRRTESQGSFTQFAQSEEGHLLDGLYASLEDRFRGERDEIRQRVEVYLPVLREARVTDGVLDVACGRGEWLELLKKEDIQARGVDHNRIFVEDCRRAGLEVIEEDALVYLRSLEAESLNVVTAFHLVEHLPFEVLIKLLDEAVRVLRSGGLLILETPNPENFIVSSFSFYADPTHRNPIPSQTLQFLLESRGLKSIDVMKLRPWDAAKLEGDSEIIKRFNEYFYSAPDYGIVARKP